MQSPGTWFHLYFFLEKLIIIKNHTDTIDKRAYAFINQAIREAIKYEFAIFFTLFLPANQANVLPLFLHSHPLSYDPV